MMKLCAMDENAALKSKNIKAASATIFCIVASVGGIRDATSCDPHARVGECSVEEAGPFRLLDACPS